MHCAKSVRILSFSGPYFSAFRVNTEIISVNQSECGKIRTRKTPNTDTFYVVVILVREPIHISHLTVFWLAVSHLNGLMGDCVSERLTLEVVLRYSCKVPLWCALTEK